MTIIIIVLFSIVGCMKCKKCQQGIERLEILYNLARSAKETSNYIKYGNLVYEYTLQRNFYFKKICDDCAYSIREHHIFKKRIFSISDLDHCLLYWKYINSQSKMSKRVKKPVAIMQLEIEEVNPSLGISGKDLSKQFSEISFTQEKGGSHLEKLERSTELLGYRNPPGERPPKRSICAIEDYTIENFKQRKCKIFVAYNHCSEFGHFQHHFNDKAEITPNRGFLSQALHVCPDIFPYGANLVEGIYPLFGDDGGEFYSNLRDLVLAPLPLKTRQVSGRSFCGTKQVALDVKSDHEILALNAECVAVPNEKTGKHYNFPCEIAVVNFTGKVIFHAYITPPKGYDTNFEYTGISSEEIDNNGIPLDEAYEVLEPLLETAIIVGHNVMQDLGTMGIWHPRSLIRDTNGFEIYKRNLTSLISDLGMMSDNPEGKHDPIKNCRQSLYAYKMICGAWERGLRVLEDYMVKTKGLDEAFGNMDYRINYTLLDDPRPHSITLGTSILQKKGIPQPCRWNEEDSNIGRVADGDSGDEIAEKLKEIGINNTEIMLKKRQLKYGEDNPQIVPTREAYGGPSVVKKSSIKDTHFQTGSTSVSIKAREARKIAPVKLEETSKIMEATGMVTTLDGSLLLNSQIHEFVTTGLRRRVDDRMNLGPFGQVSPENLPEKIALNILQSAINSGNQSMSTHGRDPKFEIVPENENDDDSGDDDEETDDDDGDDPNNGKKPIDDSLLYSESESEDSVGPGLFD